MRHRGNFNTFSAHAWYVPGVGGMLVLLALLLAGVALGGIVTMIFTAAMGQEAANEYAMLIAYPLQFLPAMLFAAIRSRDRSFDSGGFALDSNRFAPLDLRPPGYGRDLRRGVRIRRPHFGASAHAGLAQVAHGKHDHRQPLG